MRRETAPPIRPEIPAPSMKAMPPTAPLASIALRPRATMAPTAPEASIPIASNFATIGMLAHDHVDDDKDQAKRESAQASNGGGPL